MARAAETLGRVIQKTEQVPEVIRSPARVVYFPLPYPSEALAADEYPRSKDAGQSAGSENPLELRAEGSPRPR